MMLSDRGIGVPDAQDCWRALTPMIEYRALQRAIARNVALGAWCDTLSLADILSDTHRLAMAHFLLRNARDRARKRRIESIARAWVGDVEDTLPI